MPIIRPKSPEILQAQAAAFGAEYVGYGDGQELAREVGNAAIGLELSFDQSPSRREHGLTIREQEYLEFLRQSGGSRSEPIQYRAGLLEKYEDLAGKAEGILSKVRGTNPETWDEHPGFLAHGKTSAVFGMDNEGQSYALRVPKVEGFGIDREYIDPGLKMLGKNCMEQVVAASYEKGVTIAELAPGQGLDNIDPEELLEVTDAQLRGLIGALREMQKSGLIIDTNGANLLYDREAGFTFIDTIDKKHRRYAPEGNGSIASLVQAGAHTLIFPLEVREHGPDPKLRIESPEEKTRLYDIFIPLMERYKAVCGEEFAEKEEELSFIEYGMDAIIKRLEYLRPSPQQSGGLEEAQAA